jgi:DNA polymerase-3 subunit beta
LTIISGKTLVELSGIIRDDELKLYFGQASLLVETPEFTFFSRVLEGTYPQTDRLIPNSFTTEIEINRFELLSALERILIVAKEGDGKKTNTIKMVIDKNEIKIESKEKGNKARESIDVLSFSGDAISISVNGKYLSEALKAISVTDVQLSFSGKLNPVVVKGKDEMALHLVLPYRTNES